eukprot:s3677_g9.t1
MSRGGTFQLNAFQVFSLLSCDQFVIFWLQFVVCILELASFHLGSFVTWAMDANAQREFVRDHVDADLQFILGESGVSLQNQVAIGRHYGSLRKFSALGDDRAAIRVACLQDFAIPGDTPEARAQTASAVAAWETAKEYMAKEVELKAEAKILGQPRILQIHE